jgi:hypothetical protein
MSKKLKKKGKNDKEKKAANEAKVGQVKVGMKKFMAQMEKVGLLAVDKKTLVSRTS